MATILELEQREEVIRLDPGLEPDELAQRTIFVLPKVIGQIEALEGVESLSGAELNPLEQFYEFVAHFVSGGELEMPTQFHELRHREDGIWELKTRDLRFFGWFHQRDCFICTDLQDATFVKHGPPGYNMKGSLYTGFGGNVARARALLPLDDPKHITGTEPSHVLSNFAAR